MTAAVTDVALEPVSAPPALEVGNESNVSAYESGAALLTVETDEDYGSAGELLLGIKALRQEIAEFFEPLVRKAHEAHKALTMARAEKEQPLANAERVIKGKLDAYAREQKRLADERAAQERARLEQEERARRDAEAERLEAEAAAYAVADPIVAAELVDAAQAVRSEPIAIPTPAAKPLPKVAGLSHRENWDADVVDLLALVQHVAAHPEHLPLVQANEASLRAMAKSLKSAMSIPGVRAVNKGGMSASPARGRYAGRA